ncbi:MAG: hypothetical protein WC156_09690 [Pedobacter sp.]
MSRINQRQYGSLGKAALGAMIAIIMLVVTGQGAMAAVTKATLSPAKKVYSGDCPAKVVFKGTITVNAPGIVSYIFTRSDGATDTITKKLKFLAAGSKAVSTTWTLGGAALPNFKGWQAIKILSPNPLESAHADFEVYCDPPANSAKAAHGNTDWHIDTANEFLFCKDMAGSTTAANCAPVGWTKNHIHVGLTNTAKYYYDKSHLATGSDTDAGKGIDKPMLFFYAGHGNPTTWNTLGDNGHQTDMLLGNILGNGQLRYFWQCSCETFAHGPWVCSGSDCDYSEPQNFDGSADSAAMRNVFDRWGPVIGDDLRMACGVSTLAYCHEGNVNSIWNKFNNEGRSVAESFILGLGSASVKPLCITRGGSNIANTPLYDTTFTNKRNTSGKGYLHILYSGGTQTEPPMIIWRPDLIPLKLWRVRLIPPGDPVEFKRLLVIKDKVEQLRDPQLAGAFAIVKRNMESGAISMSAVGATTLKTTRSVKTEAAQRKTALDFARRIGWLGKDAGAIQVTRMLTASRAEDSKNSPITHGKQDVIVSILQRVSNGDQSVDVLGSGGRISVTLAPGGEVLSATRTWRQTELTREQVSIKPFERAQAEAMKKLGNADAYKLAEWRFGYKQASANVVQNELPVVYEFDFVPKDREKLIDYPPQQIEVNAEEK